MESLTRVITDSMLKGVPVRLQDVGTIYPFFNKPKNTHNPKTKQIMMTSGKTTAKFTISQSLKDKLNPGYKPLENFTSSYFNTKNNGN